MIQSMTGFATTYVELPTASYGPVQAAITIKTLNGKFFETVCKLPYIVSSIEHTIIQRCKEQLMRGTVTVSMHISTLNAFKSTITPSLAVIEGYCKAIDLIQTQLDIPGEIEIKDIIALPHVFETQDEVISNHAQEICLAAVNTLLSAVVAMRLHEGTALQQDLESRIALIEEQLQSIAPRVSAVAHQRREQLLKEISVSLDQVSPEIRELHLQALYHNIDKMDVHEELVRFRTHITTFRETIRDNTPIKGKKLDFIIQELFREINTINAKLSDVSSINPILTIKTELERMREQVQNIA